MFIYKEYLDICDLYVQTKVSWKKSTGRNIRKGQFFCNKFPALNDAEPTLFYEENDTKASEMIERHIKW